MAAYAEKMLTAICLHMETLKKLVFKYPYLLLTIRKVTIFRKNNNFLEYWRNVVKFIDNIAEKDLSFYLL